MEPIDYAKELFVADHICTYTGVYINVFEPNPATINIVDIAHALAQKTRYGGHLPKFYSVAQHSLHVARLVPVRLKLAALLHDAAEAYLPDLPSPIKARMPEYKAVENHLLSVILKKFGCFDTYLQSKDELKVADIHALKVEWDVLMKGRNNPDPLFNPYPCDLDRVEELFIAKFRTYEACAFA